MGCPQSLFRELLGLASLDREPDERDDDRANQRTDDSAWAKCESFAADQARQGSAHKRTEQTGDDCKRPVDTALRLTENELAEGADEHAPQNDGENKHEVEPSWGSTRMVS